MLRSVGVEAGSLLIGGPTDAGPAEGVEGPPPVNPGVGTGLVDVGLFDKLVGGVFRLPCLLRGKARVDWAPLGSLVSTLCWEC